jgi:protein-tyrosine-phosphatase
MRCVTISSSRPRTGRFGRSRSKTVAGNASPHDLAQNRREQPGIGFGSVYLRARYGGKRAFVCHLRTLALLRLGRLRRYREVNWPQVERLVFVCKGNICRSAYAQAKAGFGGFPAASFGIEATPGAAADDSAIAYAEARMISLRTHRTTSLQSYRARPGDLLVCMEPSHAALVGRIFARQGLQITLLGLWSQPRRPWLFDPYGACRGYWNTALDIIDSGVEHITGLIKRSREGGAP